ncbi:MAG: hypothetical protein U0547_12010 [Dehalococcoidia bacterium]
MHVDAQPCPDCGTLFDLPDNYCRHCGMYLAALKATLPAPAPERAVVTSRPGMPAPVKKAATALAIGTALQVGVTLAGKYLASQAARGASQAVQSPQPRRRVEPRRQPDPEIERAAAVSETVIIRREWIRRD